MPNFARALDWSLFARHMPRRGDARPDAVWNGARSRILGAVVAAVVCVVATGATRSRPVRSATEWDGARAAQALPLFHSRSLHRADDGPRWQRVRPPHPDAPLAAHASQSVALARALDTAPATASAQPPHAVAARGYDATAPPVS